VIRRPGGGSVAALMGALGASLGHGGESLGRKRGWTISSNIFSKWAVKAQELQRQTARGGGRRQRSFNKVMAAFHSPSNPLKKKQRAQPKLIGDQIRGGDSLKVMETHQNPTSYCAEWRRREIRIRFQMWASNLRHCGVHRWRSVDVRINLAALKDENLSPIFRRKL